jgi:hypothetical protein
MKFILSVHRLFIGCLQLSDERQKQQHQNDHENHQPF